jgi:hypothetical protein
MRVDTAPDGKSGRGAGGTRPGTGITAAFSLHCGGVLKTATWPASNAHQLYDATVRTVPGDGSDRWIRFRCSPGRRITGPQ